MACHYKYRKGKTYEDLYGIEKSDKIKEKIAIKTFCNNNNNMCFVTNPHLLIKNGMIKGGLYDGFKTSQRLFYFEIDELNMFLKLCLEIDGDYWHSLPKKQIADKRKNTYLKNKGFTVLRIKEKDIYKDIDKCINRIREAIYDKTKI